MKILINTLRLVTSALRVLAYNCTVMQELLPRMVKGNNNNDCGLTTYSPNKRVNSN